MRLALRFALPALVLWLLPSVASATQVLALSLRELVEGADRVVVGTVIAQEAHYDDLDRIVTDSTLRVDETLYGEPAETLVVRHVGGVVGELGLSVAGEERYEDGARMLLFLRAYGSGDAGIVWRPVGMSQGEMPVVDRGAGDVILPGGAGVTTVQQGSDGQLRPAPGALDGPIGYDELLARVRDLVREVHP